MTAVFFSVLLAVLGAATAKPHNELFEMNFDVECLAALDANATKDAEQFFVDNIGELKWESNGAAMLYFMGLICSLGISTIPNPNSENKKLLSRIMFLVWCTLQMLLMISQVLGLVTIVAAYMCMRRHFGECLRPWTDGGSFALLDLTAMATAVWLPPILGRLLSIEVGFLTSLDGLNVVEWECLFKLVRLVKAAFDCMLAGGALLSLAVWGLSFAWLFTVPLAGISLVMVIVLVLSVRLVKFLAQSLPSCVQSAVKHLLPTCVQNNLPKCVYERLEVKEDKDAKEATGWIDSLTELPKQWSEALDMVTLARIAVPRFALLGLLCLTVAPSIVTSTWLAWEVYGGKVQTDDVVSLYHFCLLTFMEGMKWPSFADWNELCELLYELYEFVTGLHPSKLIDTLLSLGDLDLELPELLLKRSRIWGALGVVISALKKAISLLDDALKVEWKCWETTSLKEAATIKMLKKRGYYSIRQMGMAGYKFSATEHKEAGCSAGELREAGFHPYQLRQAYNAKELNEAGYSAWDMCRGNFSAKELLEAGFTPEDVLRAAFHVGVMYKAGYSAKELKEAGCDATILFRAGFSKGELRKAGFTNDELQEAQAGCYD